MPLRHHLRQHCSYRTCNPVMDYIELHYISCFLRVQFLLYYQQSTATVQYKAYIITNAAPIHLSILCSILSSLPVDCVGGGTLHVLVTVGAASLGSTAGRVSQDKLPNLSYGFRSDGSHGHELTWDRDDGTFGAFILGVGFSSRLPPAAPENPKMSDVHRQAKALKNGSRIDTLWLAIK